MFTRWFRFVLHELRLVRTFKDTGILLEKAGYLAPRLFGRFLANRHVPPSLQLEPTNVCTVRCICCTTRHSRREKGFMPSQMFRSIIDQAAAVGVRRIHLYLHGEPLLHPEIVDMIRYLKVKNLSVHLTTSGMPLDQEMIEALLNSGMTLADHFVFSVLGNTAAVHEQVMPGVNHDRVVSNILGMYEFRHRKRLNGPVIETIFYSMPENSHEERSFYDFWQSKVDHVRVVGKTSRLFANYHTSDNRDYLRTRTCPNIWERMTIFWNGDVTLCCADVNGTYVLGNVQEKSIAELWTCPEMMAVRRVHMRKRFAEIPICAHCDM